MTLFDMSLLDMLLIGGGAFAAGAVNAIAGGGTFFSFPALLMIGIPPVVANASNSVAQWPGSLTGAWAYRRELVPYKRYLLPMGAASLLGGVAGGLLLLSAGDARFSALIPWLLAFATLLFAFSPQLAATLKHLRARHGQVKPQVAAEECHGSGSPAGWLVQLLVSIYGGFFGAGMGILMMASLAIGGHEDVQHINALKNLLSAVVYSITVATFVVAGAVSWPHTLVMVLTASLGGYLGARMARNIRGPWLRRMVIAVGTVLTLYYFSKTLG
ncbi:sulfite exporter TauE/SafE family protein [Polaromonas sp. SM01]|uniref:sulfite exporter TauE/SafE family protein n=1 Tax=Polaromonas sp. SM01 TaxID=3085630 RepID=UPI002982AF31|nr:sulfite exporter TauE/SafE family protein [Polaromonas sp. SM01]MDW5441441.1 sulfite exporter TauE/SafE family protein [Polaromonas sp. SM01]